MSQETWFQYYQLSDFHEKREVIINSEASVTNDLAGREKGCLVLPMMSDGFIDISHR